MPAGRPSEYTPDFGTRALDGRERRFVDEYLIDLDANRAALAAGYSKTMAASKAYQWVSSSKAKPHVFMAVEAAQRARAARIGITQDRVIDELRKIGFSDIRKLVKWQGSLVKEEDNPDGGEVLVIKNIVTNHVQIIDSDTIDDDTAAAIAEISQNATGGIKVKMYDKKSALVDIGKHLGMFTEKHEHTGPGGSPLIPEAKPPRELAKLILSIFAQAQQGTDAPDSTDV